jgi:dGTP triphosphohydrolase
MQDITQESQQIEEIPRPLEVRLGYENVAQSARLLTSLLRRASDNHIVQLSTRSLGPWLGLLFEVRTAFGRGMGTVVRSATEETRTFCAALSVICGQ